MDDTTGAQHQARERVGSRAWVRTVGLIGGGLMAGGILAGTVTANAATGEATAPTPPAQEEVTRAATAAEGTSEDVAPADCPDDGAGADAGTVPDGGTTPSGGADGDAAA